MDDPLVSRRTGRIVAVLALVAFAQPMFAVVASPGLEYGLDGRRGAAVATYVTCLGYLAWSVLVERFERH